MLHSFLSGFEGDKSLILYSGETRVVWTADASRNFLRFIRCKNKRGEFRRFRVGYQPLF
jgi:hypothetical protein